MSPGRPNGKGAVTLRDVARMAGVHPGTASRALNADTRGLVNRDTAQRVLSAAEELGYLPNPIARGLKTSRSYTVGVLIPDLTNPLFPPIVRGIEDRLEDSGYTPLIANTDNDPEREKLDVATMRARQVDGLITATARRDHQVLAEAAEHGLPLVLVNRRLEDDSLPAAAVDDERGARLAVEHLVGLGHKRIAHLAGPKHLSTGSLRHAGFVAAMRELGVEPDPALILFGERFTIEEGARICRELLSRGRAPTAIVAGNDLMALGCCDALREAGLDCPADVSLIGFNDMPFADRFSPPLTTIHIPHYDVGVAAAELLLEQLEDEDVPPRRRILDPSLVVRGSTAPPRE
jgi:LacI family transcriptional regulator